MESKVEKFRTSMAFRVEMINIVTIFYQRYRGCLLSAISLHAESQGPEVIYLIQWVLNESFGSMEPMKLMFHFPRIFHFPKNLREGGGSLYMVGR